MDLDVETNVEELYSQMEILHIVQTEVRVFVNYSF